METWPHSHSPAAPRADTPSAEDRLLYAIGQNDLSGFYQALRDRPEVNHDGGKPLQAAAQTGNLLFLKELVLRGADIPHAQRGLEQERDAIPRKRIEDRWGDYSYTYKNKADKKRYSDIGQQIKALKDYQKIFIETVAPVEAARLQFQILEELRDLKREITEAIHGTPLPKRKLAAPAAANLPHAPKG